MGNSFEIAADVFNRIKNQFPYLEINKNCEASVELMFTIPKQPTINHEISMFLQNNGELTLAVGHFQLEWFPCTNSEIVAAYLDAATGLISGQYRVLESYRNARWIRADLQEPIENEKWRSIGTWSLLHIPLPWDKKHYKVLKSQ